MGHAVVEHVPDPTERWIRLGLGTARLPERLLLAHSRGEVLFIAGAGVSIPSGLPSFEDLTRQVYSRLDAGIYEAIADPPRPTSNLSLGQRAEVERFRTRDYDVALGMLERRMDPPGTSTSMVRNAVTDILRKDSPRPTTIHKSLIGLADRGAATTILTTNFDTLLEASAPRAARIPTYALGAIPRPSQRAEFAGVLHIHGVLPRDGYSADFIVTDQDFGEFYLRRRIVPDLIYDSARLYHLVLVGYTANDAPMRYLLNAVAADGSRFTDLRERFVFVGESDPPNLVALEDWKGRGITPIPYNEANYHQELTETLSTWSGMSAINGNRARTDAIVKRLVSNRSTETLEDDRDLFEHLFRRGSLSERMRLSQVVARTKPDFGWLDLMRTACATKQ